MKIMRRSDINPKDIIKRILDECRYGWISDEQKRIVQNLKQLKNPSLDDIDEIIGNNLETHYTCFYCGQYKDSVLVLEFPHKNSINDFCKNEKTESCICEDCVKSSINTINSNARNKSEITKKAEKDYKKKKSIKNEWPDD